MRRGTIGQVVMLATAFGLAIAVVWPWMTSFGLPPPRVHENHLDERAA